MEYREKSVQVIRAVLVLVLVHEDQILYDF
jgi:hypothetical protein